MLLLIVDLGFCNRPEELASSKTAPLRVPEPHKYVTLGPERCPYSSMVYYISEH